MTLRLTIIVHMLYLFIYLYLLYKNNISRWKANNLSGGCTYAVRAEGELSTQVIDEIVGWKQIK